jgi:hypothetical protein
MIEYCTGIASEFEAKLNRVRTFIPDHNLTSGTANEIMLRDFLAQMSTSSHKVGQGFICDPVDSDLVSKQCDVLVHDHHQYPKVYSAGEIDIVFPQAVKMVIEVKTDLKKKALHDGLENIRSANRLNWQINGVVFAFNSLRAMTIVEHLQRYDKMLPMEHAPIAILLLNKRTIIHRWTNSELDGGDILYEVRKCDSSATVIAFLLLHFFDIQMQGVWGGASIANMMRFMLDSRTEILAESIKIGSGVSE